MVQKSYGKMRRSRKKMTSKGKIGLTAYLRKFNVGDTVHISFISSSPVQHPRFHGRTGSIVEKRGRNYVVKIMDGSVEKKIFARPEHLKLQK